MEWFWWDWSLSQWPTGYLQCFDAVGWVIWPVKIISKMTYRVSNHYSLTTIYKRHNWKLHHVWQSETLQDSVDRLQQFLEVVATYNWDICGYRVYNCTRNASLLARPVELQTWTNNKFKHKTTHQHGTKPSFRLVYDIWTSSTPDNSDVPIIVYYVKTVAAMNTIKTVQSCWKRLERHMKWRQKYYVH